MVWSDYLVRPTYEAGRDSELVLDVLIIIVFISAESQCACMLRDYVYACDIYCCLGLTRSVLANIAS